MLRRAGQRGNGAAGGAAESHGKEAAMDVESFIARWAGSDRLLDTKAPTDDPDDDGYCFERRITKSAGGGGFADVWKRGHFALEYKRPGADLDRAFEQVSITRLLLLAVAASTAHVLQLDFSPPASA